MVNLKRLFGFTKSGASLIGTKARVFLKRRWVNRGLGVILVATLTSVILVHNLANIGGNLALATSSVKPVIDATTKSSIQKPVENFTQTRGLSWYHAGADLAAPVGTPVKSIMAGMVRAVNQDLFGYGIHVIITHDQGFESLYGHLSKFSVNLGQKVDLGTIIGEIGSTGLSTGPHLHLEIRQNTQLVNPADIVPGVN
jgi:murein DD-endopeptidase MepM/ murein hydrolase activator NlpD